MKFIINITIAALITMCCIPAKGQIVIDPGTPVQLKEAIYFTYDNAGNRIKRSNTLSAEPINLNSDDDEGLTLSSGELIEEETLENCSQEREIQVYPNPVREELMIDIWNGDEQENYRVFLFDSAGKLLKERLRTGNGSETVDFNSYPLGTYLLIINANGKKFEYKIVKQ